MRDPNITHATRSVCVVVWAMQGGNGHAYARTETIAAEAGASVATARRALKAAVKAGWLEADVERKRWTTYSICLLNLMSQPIKKTHQNDEATHQNDEAAHQIDEASLVKLMRQGAGTPSSLLKRQVKRGGNTYRVPSEAVAPPAFSKDLQEQDQPPPGGTHQELETSPDAQRAHTIDATGAPAGVARNAKNSQPESPAEAHREEAGRWTAAAEYLPPEERAWLLDQAELHASGHACDARNRRRIDALLVDARSELRAQTRAKWDARLAEELTRIAHQPEHAARWGGVTWDAHQAGEHLRAELYARAELADVHGDEDTMRKRPAHDVAALLLSLPRVEGAA